MRAFVRLRQMLLSHVELARKIELMEKKYNTQFKVVFDVIRALMSEPEKPPKKIGFMVKEKQAGFGVKGKRR